MRNYRSDYKINEVCTRKNENNSDKKLKCQGQR